MGVKGQFSPPHGPTDTRPTCSSANRRAFGKSTHPSIQSARRGILGRHEARHEKDFIPLTGGPRAACVFSVRRSSRRERMIAPPQQIINQVKISWRFGGIALSISGERRSWLPSECGSPERRRAPWLPRHLPRPGKWAVFLRQGAEQMRRRPRTQSNERISLLLLIG